MWVPRQTRQILIATWVVLVWYCDTFLLNSQSVHTDLHKRSKNKNQHKEVGGKEGVTIIIMTYQRVDELLGNPLMQDIIPLDIVKQLIIIWNDHKDLSKLPQVQEAFDGWGLSHKLQIVIPNQNSLNNQFTSIPNITTTALYSTDDEWTVSVDNFLSAFQWWQTNPEKLVGFVPRRVKKKKGYVFFPDRNYLAKVNREPYNILLPGGGMFFHAKYLYAYKDQNDNKVEARKYVDDVFNCEDILFNFMIPREFHPPLLVAFNNTETRPYLDRKDGISSTPNHVQNRNDCIREFERLLGWPFKDTQTVVTIPPGDFGVSLIQG
jgi:glucuronyl/N-acetylglucosaminyl transferase EXT2